MHPRSKQWHLINYVIVRRRDRLCGAECWTNYCLIISKVSIGVQPKTRPLAKNAPKRLNFTKLKDVPTKPSFLMPQMNNLIPIFFDVQGVETALITLLDTVYRTDVEYLGPSNRTHRDWFDENQAVTMDLIGKKCAAHLVHLQDPQFTTKKEALRCIRSIIQHNLPEIHDSLLVARADEIQVYAEKNDMKKHLQRSEGGL